VAGTLSTRVLFDKSGWARALQQPTYQLKVLRGPDSRQQKRVSSPRTIIGSGQGAGFRLTDPTVSAVHCELVVDHTGVRARDLGAKNGLVVDGRRVTETWLKSTDQLTLGNSIIRFKLLDEAEEGALDADCAFGRLWGRSVRMRQLFGELQRAARSNATVLLIGETGTGKELAGEAIALEGPRGKRPFLVLDCAGLQTSLAETELFGHEKGAFTGAVDSQAGVFERAQGGTVFLDEIAELPIDLQPKLLGVLERRLVRRVGGDRVIPVDVRIVAATHHDLAADVNRGTFRADLYYRLAGVEIHLPALREHAEDIPELIARFLDELPGAPKLAPDQLDRLSAADYPGNIRQLRNAVERAALGIGTPDTYSRHAAIDLSLPFRIQKERCLAGFERDYLIALLEATKGNVSEASRRSGISRVHLYELLRKAGIRVHQS
jgi:two-component system, NtrC family, response regulator GlrR